MKNLLVKIGVAMLSMGIIYVLALIFANDHYWCFKDHDTCAIEEMDYYRGLKAAAIKQENERHDSTLVTLTEHYDSKINPLKPTISTGRALEEFKKGNKQNVPEGFVALRQAFIPQALASSGETLTESPVTNISTSTPAVMHFAPAINFGRYGKILAEKGSPYASLPIERYCDENGLKARQCDLILGVAQHESQSGTDFACDYKTKTVANLLGQYYYHNPVGIKDLRPEGERERKTPDENGCYLRRFDSFEAFWKWYIPHMVVAYNWKEVTDVTYLSGCYVHGKDKDTGKCLAPALEWAGTVHGFANRVAELN